MGWDGRSMKASDVVGDQVDCASASADKATALGRTGQEAFQSAVATLSRKVDGWTSGLEKYAAAERGDRQSGRRRPEAPAGKNPVWMTIKGAWQGASVRLRVAAYVSVPSCS